VPPAGSNHCTFMGGAMSHLTRRRFVGSVAGLGAAAALPALGQAQGPAAGPILKRAIPSTGEQIPAVGLGTWITFNVGGNERLRAARAQVMQTFFDRGGSLIDSSPMYGSSEEVIGYGLARIQNKGALFSAGKVWTLLKPLGVNQMENSRRYWGVQRFDLMQIHNLLDWSTHLETLKEMKAQGRVRYIGITTSQGWRHGDLESIMRRERLDFVAFSYNVVDREVEERLLPLAAERGIAVIINRPFQEGVLIDRMKHHPLPPWAGEIDCANWAQFLLKFVISHPAVTCVIPATRRVDHMEENMAAMRGRMPDARIRARMTRYVETV
jgi:diketogulonate reductase-like aldo/keto reductase